MRQNFLKISLVFLLLPACSFAPLQDKLVSDDARIRSKAQSKLATLTTNKQMKLVPFLLTHLENPDSKIANRAVESLIIIGKPAIEGLRNRLNNPDTYVRLSAIAALGHIAHQAPEAIPELVSALQDANPLIRDEAAFALGQLGPAAESAGPALLEVFRRANKEQKEDIAEALKKIGIRPPSLS